MKFENNLCSYFDYDFIIKSKISLIISYNYIFNMIVTVIFFLSIKIVL